MRERRSFLHETRAAPTRFELVTCCLGTAVADAHELHYGGRCRAHDTRPARDGGVRRAAAGRFEGGRWPLMLQPVANIRQPNRRKMRAMHAERISGRADRGDLRARDGLRPELREDPIQFLDKLEAGGEIRHVPTGAGGP
jgi:hypothetical protein